MKISELNPAVKRRIKAKEALLGKKCYGVMSSTNRNGETYLYGRFGRLKDDWTPATIAIKNDACYGGWEPV